MIIPEYEVRDKLISQAIVKGLEIWGKDQYDKSNNPNIKNLQWARPRCANGCDCDLSKAWRERAESVLKFICLM